MAKDNIEISSIESSGKNANTNFNMKNNIMIKKRNLIFFLVEKKENLLMTLKMIH